NDMRRWMARCRPELIIDFHAPVMCHYEGIFCYVSRLDDDGRPLPRHAPWLHAMRAALPDAMAAQTFVRSGQYPSRWNTARIADFAHDALGVADITFETPYACSHSHLFTRACYQA